MLPLVNFKKKKQKKEIKDHYVAVKKLGKKKEKKKRKGKLTKSTVKHYLEKRFLLLNSPTSTNHSLVPTPQPLLRFFNLSRPIISNTVIAIEILIIELL